MRFIMLITTNPMLTNAKLNIYIDGKKISQVSTMNYLGIDIDSKLNWNNHIDTLCRTISPEIGLLRRFRQIWPQYNLTLIIVWPFGDLFLTKTSIDFKSLKIVLHRLSQIILEVRGVNIVKDLGWLNIKQRRDYFVGLLIFKTLNNVLLDYITDKFAMTSEIARRSTRST